MSQPRSEPAAYLVEQYLPQPTENDVESFVIALRTAAITLSATGESVRLACSLLVAADELCFHVLEAASPEAASRAAHLSGIDPERVLETAAWWPPARQPTKQRNET